MDGKLVLVVVKIFRDFLISCEPSEVEWTIKNYCNKAKFESVFHGTRVFNFYDKVIEKFEYRSDITHTDSKITTLEHFPLSRARKLCCDPRISKMELASFMSVISSIWFLGFSDLPLCAFNASNPQQKSPQTNVVVLISQAKYVPLLKSCGRLTFYLNPPYNSSLLVSNMVFSGAGILFDHDQLIHFSCLLTGPLPRD